MNLPAKEQVESYNLRWPQEKINRTSKQKFGMHQCQALALSKQKAHIMAGYLAHTIIEIANIDKQEESVDKIVNNLRQHHFNDLAVLIRKTPKTKHIPKIDYIEDFAQNYIQNSCNNTGESNAFMM